MILFSVLPWFAKKKLKSHVSCLSGHKDKAYFDCTTLKYPMYELLYLGFLAGLYRSLCGVHTLEIFTGFLGEVLERIKMFRQLKRGLSMSHFNELHAKLVDCIFFQKLQNICELKTRMRPTRCYSCFVIKVHLRTEVRSEFNIHGTKYF